MTKKLNKASRVGKLEFDLSEPFDAAAFRLATNAPNLAYILCDLKAQLRSMRKYQERENIPIEEVEKMVYDLIEEHYPGFESDYY